MRTSNAKENAIFFLCQICNIHTLHSPKWQGSVGVVTIWQNTCLKKPYTYYFLSFLFSFRVPSLWKWNKTEFLWQVLAENIGRCDEIFCCSEKFLESFCQSINLRKVTRKMKYIESLEKRLDSISTSIKQESVANSPLISEAWSVTESWPQNPPNQPIIFPRCKILYSCTAKRRDVFVCKMYILNNQKVPQGLRNVTRAKEVYGQWPLVISCHHSCPCPRDVAGTPILGIPFTSYIHIIHINIPVGGIVSESISPWKWFENVELKVSLEDALSFPNLIFSS